MRLAGLVFGMLSWGALADGSVGVPRDLGPRTLQLSAPDGGLATSLQFSFSTGIPGSAAPTAARSVLLYVSEVQTPGIVILRSTTAGVASTWVADAGWHEWELPAPAQSGYFVLETSGHVTFKYSCFEGYDFPSQQHTLGRVDAPYGWNCTGVLRLAGSGVQNGCPAPDDELVAGNPYVESFPLAPGVEQQRLRLRTDGFGVTNPLGIRGTVFADAVRLIDFRGQAHLRGAHGFFAAAATGVTDGGMSDPFVIEFQSDGGNLRAAYSYPPGGCHPVARAGLDREESRWLGGPAGSDLVFRTIPFLTGPRHHDLDADGARGPTFEWSLDADSTWNDCDDANPARHPDAGETCNGIDDDCDGLVDGPRVRTTACERTEGLCAGSRHLAADCQAGQWLSCQAQGRYPISFRADEVWCDGRDEDCDGVVDDSPTQTTCTLSLGVCAAAAVPACVSGGWTACNYGPQYEPQEATCDGLDNDCDGLTDGADSDVQAPACELTVGVCSGSMKPASACGASGWATCGNAQYGPQFEARESRCDGLDNDCDGLTDAQDSDLASVLCANQLGVCAGSTHAAAECDVSTWHSCATARLPNTWQAVEARCDGLDNDCDGVTDEGCVADPAPVRPSPQGCGCSSGGAEWTLLLLMLLSVRGGSRTRTPLLALRSERSVSPVPSTRT